MIRTGRMAMVRLDLQALWSSPRYLALIPLALAALAIGLWPYAGSPFTPVIAAVVFGTEPAFANILFRSRNDLEALALLPVPWDDSVLARNIATGVTSTTVYGLLVLGVVYAAPAPLAGATVMDALLWWGTLVFPLLSIGNELSVRHPRRAAGWTFEDVAEAGVFLAIAGVFAAIHPALDALAGSPVASLIFTAGAALLWRLRSVPATARRIRDALSTLVLTP